MSAEAAPRRGEVGAARLPRRASLAAALAAGAPALELALALLVAALLAVTLPAGSALRRATIPLIFLAGAVALARRVGAGATLRVAGVAGATGLALELLAVGAGTFRHRDPEMLRAWVPFAWAAFAFPAVALARARAHSRLRQGACAAAALLSLALLWDPLGVRAGAFSWPGGGRFAAGVVGFDGSRGIPPTSFAGWALVAACSARAAGAASGGSTTALPALHGLIFAALAWRAARAGIDGIIGPAAAAAALALWLAQGGALAVRRKRA